MTHHPLRRADRALPREEALAVLDEAPFLVLSTVGADGEPYGVPLSFVRAGDVLYVHTANEGGRKLDCFRCDGRVCATAVMDVEAFFADGDFSTRYRSAMAFGRIREVEPGAEFKHALVELCLKYVPEAKAHIGEAMRASAAQTTVWAIQMDEVTGKAQVGPAGATAHRGPAAGAMAQAGSAADAGAAEEAH